MKQQITFRQYRAMDVFFFTALLCLCETLIVLGATRWFPGEPYTLSLTPAVTAIVMVRWGAFAAAPAALGGLAFCLASGAAPAQYLVYCLGNMTAMLLLLLRNRWNWHRLHESVLLRMGYAALTALLMQLGRFLIALALGYPPAVCAGFITTDVLSVLFAVLLVWISARLDGILEDQKDYLKRIQEEQENEARRMNP